MAPWITKVRHTRETILHTCDALVEDIISLCRFGWITKQLRIKIATSFFRHLLLVFCVTSWKRKLVSIYWRTGDYHIHVIKQESKYISVSSVSLSLIRVIKWTTYIYETTNFKSFLFKQKLFVFWTVISLNGYPDSSLHAYTPVSQN